MLYMVDFLVSPIWTAFLTVKTVSRSEENFWPLSQLKIRQNLFQADFFDR